MSDPEQKKEIRRMRALLQKMAEMAEHVEQTGSFESGAHNYMKRYNAIVEHLEDSGALAEDLFPKLDDDTDFGQLGAEAKLLADYLDDVVEEAPTPSGKQKGGKSHADLGILVALAPFLGTSELSKLVRQHFDTQAEEKPAARSEPDLKTIIGLAPHMDSATLGKLVRNSLANHPVTDPSLLVALAPHMNSEEFGEILRENFPEWFGEAPATPPTPPPPPPTTAPEPPEPPQSIQNPGAWLQTLSEKLERG